MIGRAYDDCGHYWGMGLYWWFLALLIIVVAFVFLGTASRSHFKSSSPNDINFKVQTPLHILLERFAKGEITEDEYEKRKAVIQRDSK